MRVTSLFLLLTYFIISCNNEKKQELNAFDQAIKQQKENVVSDSLFTVKNIQWMEGKWIDSTSFKGNKIIEVWKLNGDTLLGERGTIKGNDTVFAQLSKIFMRKQTLLYQLEAKGYPSVSFKLIDKGTNKILFSNKANVAPQEIAYAFENNQLKQRLKIITPAGDRIIHSTFKKL